MALTQSPRDSLPAPAPSSLTTDLRHMTSLSALSTPAHAGSRRTSQHIGRARSPGSIPSSPTSIHSSSSAIFERDIEPLHPHPLSSSSSTRFKHQDLDNAVPAVLDAAASILTSRDNEDWVGVVSPLLGNGQRGQGLNSGWASPIGSIRSRSPSPSPGHPHTHTFYPNSPGNSTLSPLSYPPSLSPSSSPSPPSPLSPTTPLTASASSSNNKRLSFLSYADLLSSTPVGVQPLSSLTCAREEAAVHLPALAGAGGVLADGGVLGGGSPVESRAPSILTRKDRERDRERERESMLFLDGIGMGVGGEWEREGLGRGLEERLEGVF